MKITIDLELGATTRRWIRRVVLLGAPVAAMAASSLAVGVPTELKKGTVVSAAALNGNFTDLQTQIDTLESQLTTLQTQATGLDADLTALETQTDGIATQLATKADSASVPIVTNWTLYTVSVDSGGTPLQNAAGAWRRVGDSIEVRVTLNGGLPSATGSSPINFGLPTGVVVDQNKIPGSVKATTVGAGDIGTTNTSAPVMAYYYQAGVANKIRLLISGTGGAPTYYVTPTNPYTASVSAWSVSFNAVLPVTGWTAN